jgi:hypothetical protein
MSDVNVVIGVSAAHVQRIVGASRPNHAKVCEIRLHHIKVGALKSGKGDIGNFDNRIAHR